MDKTMFRGIILGIVGVIMARVSGVTFSWQYWIGVILGIALFAI